VLKIIHHSHFKETYLGCQVQFLLNGKLIMEYRVWPLQEKLFREESDTLIIHLKRSMLSVGSMSGSNYKKLNYRRDSVDTNR